MIKMATNFMAKINTILKKTPLEYRNWNGLSQYNVYHQKQIKKHELICISIMDRDTYYCH